MKRFICVLCVIMLFFSNALAAPLTNGSHGEDVAKLQKRLRELGLLSGQAAGIYGKQTSAAVQEAQRLLKAAGHEVDITGKADEKTLSLILAPDAEDVLLILRKGSSGESEGEGRGCEKTRRSRD